MSRFDVYGVASSVGGRVTSRGWRSPVGPLYAAGDFLYRAGTCCACGDGNPVPDGVDCPRLHRNVPGRAAQFPTALPRKAQVKNREAKGLVS